VLNRQLQPPVLPAPPPRPAPPSPSPLSIIIFTDAWSQKGLVNVAVDHAERELKKVVFLVPNHTDTPTAENSNIHLNL
jgi:hypothetical protein